MQARDLMSSNLVVVPPDTPVAAIAELLAARGISAVPVVDGAGKPVGIVTEGDLIRRLADRPRGPLGWFLDMFRDPKPLITRILQGAWQGGARRDVGRAGDGGGNGHPRAHCPAHGKAPDPPRPGGA